jgi:hypothetical protein
MRVCIVGSGNQGAGAGALLAREEEIQEIRFFARHLRSAERAAAHVASVRERPTALELSSGAVDAADAGALAGAVSGCDMVINATVPAFNIPIMEACLRAGAHYLDLYAYADGTQGVPDEEKTGAQLSLCPRFEEAGLLALPSLGITPGWTNVAAKVLTDRFDAIESLVVRMVDWLDSDMLLAPCDPVVLVEQWLGIPGSCTTEDGEAVGRDLVDTEESYEFLPPAGEQRILSTTNDNATQQMLALSRVPIPHMEEKFAVLSGGRSMKDIILTIVARATAEHRSSDDMIALFGSCFELCTNDMHVGEAHAAGLIRDAAFGNSLEVTGTRSGRRERHTIQTVASLEATLALMPWAPPGVLATIVEPVALTLMLARGQIEERGVRLAPDLASAPAVLEAVREWGMPVEERVDVLEAEGIGSPPA